MSNILLRSKKTGELFESGRLNLRINTQAQTSGARTFTYQTRSGGFPTRINWGDGTPIELVFDIEVTHIYAVAGVYDVQIIALNSLSTSPFYGLEESGYQYDDILIGDVFLLGNTYASPLPPKTGGLQITSILASPTNKFPGLLSSAFAGNQRLTSINSNVRIAGCTSFELAFADCFRLASFPAWNTAAITTFNAAWFRDRGLTSFPVLNYSGATRPDAFDATWLGCTGLSGNGFPSLTLNPLITRLYRTWAWAFNASSEFPFIDTSNIEEFTETFMGCFLTTIPLLDTSAATSIQRMFYGSRLQVLPDFDLTNCSNAEDAFAFMPQMLEFNPNITFGRPCRMKALFHSNAFVEFPFMDLSMSTSFEIAWATSDLGLGPRSKNLAIFPPGMFDNCTTADYRQAFVGCNSLTTASINNIYISIAASGVVAGQLGMPGVNGPGGHYVQGGQAPTGAGFTAQQLLFARGWRIFVSPNQTFQTEIFATP